MKNPPDPPDPRDTRLAQQATALDARRVAAGHCRHCGGPVPCWSEFGDVRPGVSHEQHRLRWKTITALQQTRKRR